MGKVYRWVFVLSLEMGVYNLIQELFFFLPWRHVYFISMMLKQDKLM